MKRFWNHERCGPKIHTKISNIHSIIRKWQKMILCGPICVATVFCLKPLFDSNYRFIYYIWIPWSSEMFNVLVLFTQYYLTVFITPIVYGCDFLYVSYSIHVASQIHLLNGVLERLEGKSSNSDICECVRHHQLILSLVTFLYLH